MTQNTHHTLRRTFIFLVASFFVSCCRCAQESARVDFCPGCVSFCRAGADGRVFVLRGCSQNVPPLVAANGRCACLCINQGAVNLPFNRWGSRASNYFCIVNAQPSDCVQGQRPTATSSSVKTCSHSTVSLLLFRHTYQDIFSDLDKRYTKVLQETLMRLNEVLLWYQPNKASAQSETCMMCHRWNIKLNKGFHLFFVCFFYFWKTSSV